eukprot:CAMPEP_0204175098 /NCGR_PEP_ID=MMETSP0361-20130328/46456_1 /ASSEMBLY_ACC=CAM_ASM_000343 /TAXON_ID=268821 /ORGANISM="Scrippsiella Hangoei, Strain SHTV-5" /LENGTH=40 /DNA_ID= /DNA_START= /DNA_END= /DNA_ORIENTATION=
MPAAAISLADVWRDDVGGLEWLDLEVGETSEWVTQADNDV